MHSNHDLAQALRTLPHQPANGIFHRSIWYKYFVNIQGTPNPLYSLGSSQMGARFTPRGAMPTLYLAEQRDTAQLELLGMTPAEADCEPSLQRATPPMVTVSVTMQLGCVLDLTQAPVLHALGTTVAELQAGWMLPMSKGLDIPTWRLGQALHDSGRFAALRYESCKRSGFHCLAVFPDCLAGNDFIEINDPDHNLQQRLEAV